MVVRRWTLTRGDQNPKRDSERWWREEKIKVTANAYPLLVLLGSRATRPGVPVLHATTNYTVQCWASDHFSWIVIHQHRNAKMNKKDVIIV